jgi:poly-beta-1,6-N-acetyl-D-glucosamine synthase
MPRNGFTRSSLEGPHLAILNGIDLVRKESGASAGDALMNSASQTRYVIITPVRDEEENLEVTIRSVAAQTARPQEWIIVNDGSTDRTAEILDRFASEYGWIRPVHLANRGHREPGGGVIRAFQEGFRQVKMQDWEFIVKLDGDLQPEPDYFEKCFEEFRSDSTLAIGGGTICHEMGGALRPDLEPKMHVRGATKIYRRAFWEVSGGLIPVPGWDTLDEAKANMMGWTTRSFPHVRLLHRRLTGAADGAWRNWFKNGRANYITGYHPVFMILKCLKRVRQKPYVIAAAGLFCGFVSGYFTKVPQVNDAKLIRYVRTQQIRRLFFQPSIWK